MSNAEFLKSLGMELRVARMRKGLTRREVSKVSGISTDALGQVERGECDSKVLTYKRIADALRISMKDFM